VSQSARMARVRREVPDFEEGSANVADDDFGSEVISELFELEDRSGLCQKGKK
jgi:hypothetical protein